MKPATSDLGQLVVPPESSFGFLRSRAVLTDPVVMVLIALAITGILAAKPLAVSLSALVLVTIGLGRAWARVALVDVRYHCAVSEQRLVVGETFHLSMVIENRKVLPIPWLRVIDFVPQGVSVDGATAMFSEVPGTHQIEAWLRLRAYERVRLPRRLKALRRGIYRFGRARLIASDLFGFYEVSGGVAKRSEEVVVYPRTVPLTGFSLPHARPMGDHRARRALIVDPTRPVGIREYRAGDRIRDIDWKATAKRGEPYVRTHESSVAGHVVILLECRSETGVKLAVKAATLEDSVSTAASIAVHLFGLGYGVGLVTNGAAPGEGGPVVIPPASGPNQPGDLLKGLAGVHGMTSRSLEDVVHTGGSEAIPYGATIVYVTSLVRPDVVEGLREFRAKGCEITIAYAGKVDPPITGGVPLLDMRFVPELLLADTASTS